jgi:hypothetical protein
MAEGRVVHLKREPYDVRIDRATRWGNPFKLGASPTSPLTPEEERTLVINRYREWATTSQDGRARWVREHVHELRGKTLGCWCAPSGGVTAKDTPWCCHGQVLLELAVQDGGEGERDG